MPNGDPRDGFFYPILTLVIDSYIMTRSSVLLHVHHAASLKITVPYPIQSVGPKAINEPFFMLNSTEHSITTAHKN